MHLIYICLYVRVDSNLPVRYFERRSDSEFLGKSDTAVGSRAARPRGSAMTTERCVRNLRGGGGRTAVDHHTVGRGRQTCLNKLDIASPTRTGGGASWNLACLERVCSHDVLSKVRGTDHSAKFEIVPGPRD